MTLRFPQLTNFQKSAPRLIAQLVSQRGLHSRLLPRNRLSYTLLPLSFLTIIFRHTLLQKPSYHNLQRRNFKSTSHNLLAKAIYNPRKDDEGNDMKIEITPRASSRLKEIMAEDSNPNLAIRIQVENGGCHGFQYNMSLTTLPSIETYSDNVEKNKKSAKNFHGNPNTELPQASSSSISISINEKNNDISTLSEDDTVFAADDGTGAKVVMDISSLEVLKGSKVDYTMELIGSQFKIIDNPLATSSCGCGTSFDIK